MGIERISEFDTLTGVVLVNKKTISIFPASHFVTSEDKLKIAIKNIRKELEERLEFFKSQNKLLEYQTQISELQCMLNIPLPRIIRFGLNIPFSAVKTPLPTRLTTLILIFPATAVKQSSSII